MRKRFFTLSILLLCACSRDPEGLNEKDCDDGKDNDLDGRYDCDDDGCAASATCVNLARKTLEAALESAPAPMPVKRPATSTENLGPVFDVSGLMVQRAENGTDLKWAEADQYCSRLTLLDKSDWRLPTDEEAVKIIESGKLKNEPSYVMWTSTRKGESRAVIVGISGAVNEISVRSKGQCRARCVRGSIAK
jgi:hypothetical protein